MKTLTAIIAIILLPLLLLSQTTNILILTWNEPPGFSSKLYISTNLNSPWTEIGTVQPPYQTEPTNHISFFYVYVAPTNQFNTTLIFTNDPNDELLKPMFTNLPALSYGDDAFDGLWRWSPSLQLWE